MTGAGVSFIVLGLLLSTWLGLRFRSYVYPALFLVHLGGAFFMWSFTLYRVSDSYFYYAFAGDFSEFRVGTIAVSVITAYLRDLFGASYLDMYMIYQLAGYAGLVAFFRVCQEQFLSKESLDRRQWWIIHCAVALPSLSVWTSVVGKDSLMFLGTMCCVFGAVKPGPRVWSMILGFVICFVLRPHVGALVLVTCVLAVTMDRQAPSAWKLIAISTVAIVLLAVAPTVVAFVGLEASDSESVSRYVESRQAMYAGYGSGVDISDYSFPVQFFNYMYRPLFFDASNAIGLLVSVESLFYLVVTVLLAADVWRMMRSPARNFFFVFNLAFWLMATSIFAMTTSNLGIAMRQKTAFLPSFFLMALAASAERRRARDAAGVRLSLPEASASDARSVAVVDL